jgi:hypothetical protein
MNLLKLIWQSKGDIMFGLKRASIWLGVCAVLAVSGSPQAKAGVILITQEEARLPPPRIKVSSRAITRGPRIEIPDIDDGKLHSPLHFKLKFHAYGGSKIDPSSVTVTYLRGSNIDLTPRVMPYVNAAGIDIPDAEVPAGEHAIRVELKDSEGRAVQTSFTLAVAKN